eukprot:1377355-Amorphochlora_amoeboformis.AAC.1
MSSISSVRPALARASILLFKPSNKPPINGSMEDWKNAIMQSCNHAIVESAIMESWNHGIVI